MWDETQDINATFQLLNGERQGSDMRCSILWGGVGVSKSDLKSFTIQRMSEVRVQKAEAAKVKEKNTSNHEFDIG